MGTEKQEEPQLSGASIRNLVKQLTSSNTKESMTRSKSSENPNPNPNPNPNKKRVRRRPHTSWPYQERLLNMAEARREIATALKFHRATMKQANDQKKQQQKQHEHDQHQPLLQMQPPPHLKCFEPEGNAKSRRNSENPSYRSLSYPPPIISNPAYPFQSSVADFPLPNQPLGLSLNFQDFTNSHSVYHPSSSSSRSSSPPELPAVGNSFQGEMKPAESHQVMDDQEMAEMRSIGDQHQMVWNDTMNLVTSARWFKFLKTMEIDPEDSLHPFDEAWLYPSDVCFQQQFDGFSSSHDPDLPWMDIGDIDGTDGEWLS